MNCPAITIVRDKCVVARKISLLTSITDSP